MDLFAVNECLVFSQLSYYMQHISEVICVLWETLRTTSCCLFASCSYLSQSGPDFRILQPCRHFLGKVVIQHFQIVQRVLNTNQPYNIFFRSPVSRNFHSKMDALPSDERNIGRQGKNFNFYVSPQNFPSLSLTLRQNIFVLQVF